MRKLIERLYKGTKKESEVVKKTSVAILERETKNALANFDDTTRRLESIVLAAETQQAVIDGEIKVLVAEKNNLEKMTRKNVVIIGKIKNLFS